MFKILTIVIPTYNMEKYLHRCLDSLLIENQDIFNSLEVLIINDGSKDSSSAIAHTYESKYSNVFRVIDKDNGNYGSCINCGIDEAKGKYLKILDADDWYNTGALESLLLSIQNTSDDIDVFFTEFTYHDFYKNHETEYKFKTVEYNKTYKLANIPFADSIDEFLLKMYSVTIKVDILRKIGLRLDTGISYTDNEYMYFPYSHIDNVTFFNYDVYQYFIGREGQTISAVKNEKHLRNVMIITERELDDYIERGRYIEKDNIKNVLLKMVLGRCLAYYEQALTMLKNENLDSDMKRLYLKIYKDKDLLNALRRTSFSFLLWEKTGLNKTSSLIKIVYKIKKIISNLN